MIGIGLPYYITHHLRMACAYSLAVVGDQTDRFNSIVMEAFEVSFPIFGFPTFRQFDSFEESHYSRAHEVTGSDEEQDHIQQRILAVHRAEAMQRLGFTTAKPRR